LRDLTSDYLIVAHKALLWLKQALVFLIRDTSSIADLDSSGSLGRGGV